MIPTLDANTPRQLVEQLIAASLDLGTPWLTELYRSAAAGRLTCTLLDRACGRIEILLELHSTMSLAQPVMVVVGDDDEQPTGPSGWACARDVMQWASFVIVNGSAGDQKAYRSFVLATELFHRVALIESPSEMALAWGRAAVAAKRRHIVIMPLDDNAAGTGAKP